MADLPPGTFSVQSFSGESGGTENVPPSPSPTRSGELCISASAHETCQIAARFAAQLQRGDCVLLIGELGAGKTTFVQGLAQALGVQEPVRSPTFVLMHEYRGKFPIYHVDAYRIRNLDELREIGFEETVCSQGITVIEWGEKTEALIPHRCWRVEITLLPEQKRRISITPPNAR